MSRKLGLIAVAMAAGTDYQSAATLVSDLSGKLPSDDVEAGRVVANAVNARNYPV